MTKDFYISPLIPSAPSAEASTGGNGGRSTSLPMLSPVPSASALPPRPPKAAPSAYPHHASGPYVEQHLVAMARQRQAHDETEALWNIERKELHRKIVELQMEVHKLQLESSSSSLARYSFPGSSYYKGEGLSGGEADAQSLRHSSESSGATNFPLYDQAQNRLPLIAGADGPRKRSKSVHLRADVAANPIGGTVRCVEQLDPEFDGISFKPKIVSAKSTKAVSESDPPSPTHTSSPRPRSPGRDYPEASSSRRQTVFLHVPSHVQTKQEVPIDQLNTHLAGHTPLARMLGAHSDAGSSVDTPTVTGVPREEPRRAEAKSHRPPNERADSYFPILPVPEESPHDMPEDELDPDPELKGPLSLQANNVEGNSRFMSALDEKLNKVAREKERKESASKENEAGESGLDDEPHPPLRMKASKNFGAPWGVGASKG